MSQIKRKFIGADQVANDKILLDNNGALRAKDVGGNAVPLLKLDNSDILQMLKAPRLDSSVSGVSDSLQLTPKHYVDSQVSTVAGDLTTLEGRVTDIEQDYGAASGLATLDGAGKIPASQLPNTVLEYQGTWDADNNSPALFNGAPPTNGANDAGHVYRVSVAGTHDFGAGPITFLVGDYVLLSASYIWEKSATTDAVSSVNGYQGVVVLDAGDLNYVPASPLHWNSSGYTIETSLDEVANRLESLEVGGGDTKEVKISAADTTPGYLEDKLDVAVNKLTLTKLNVSGNEVLEFSIGSHVFDKSVDTTTDITEGTKLFFTEARARTAAVEDQIVDGVTGIAPSQNAVHDALALKLSLSGGTMSGNIDMAGSHLEHVGKMTMVSGTSEIKVDTGAPGVGILALDAPEAVILRSSGSQFGSMLIDGSDYRILALNALKLSSNSGSVKILNELSMESQKIVGLAAGVSGSDAVTFAQLSAVSGSLSAGTSASISDAVYGAAWDGVTGVAPSQNAVYDVLEQKLSLSGGTMTGTLNMGSNMIDNANQIYGGGQIDIYAQTGDVIVTGDNTVTVTATNADVFMNAGATITLAAASGVLVDGTTLDMSLNKILQLANGTASTDAANYGQVTGAQAAAELYADGIVAAEQAARESAVSGLDARITALEGVAVEWASEKVVLSSGDIANGYIDLAHLAIPESVNAFVDRLAIFQNDDYTLSTVSGVTRVTFVNSLSVTGAEALAQNDEIHVKYSYDVL